MVSSSRWKKTNKKPMNSFWNLVKEFKTVSVPISIWLLLSISISHLQASKQLVMMNVIINNWLLKKWI